MPPEKVVAIVCSKGFFPKRLAEFFLSLGYGVFFISPHSVLLETKLKSLKTNPNFTYFKSYDFKTLAKEKTPISVVYYFPGPFLENGVEILEGWLNFCRLQDTRLVLVSTLDVFKSAVSTFSVESYFGTSERDEQNFSEIENLRYQEATLWKYRKKVGVNTCVARLGDIFGPSMDFSTGRYIDRFIRGAVDERSVVVSGDGLEKHFLLFEEDACKALLLCGVSKEAEGLIVPIGYKEPVAEIELAYLLKSLATSAIDIKFLPRESYINFQDFSEVFPNKTGGFSFRPEISLKSAIAKTLTAFTAATSPKVPEATDSTYSINLQKIQSDAQTNDDTRLKIKIPHLGAFNKKLSLPKTPKIFSKHVLLALSFLVSLLVIPVFYFVANYICGVVLFSFALSKAQTLNFSQATVLSKHASAGFLRIREAPLFIGLLPKILAGKGALWGKINLYYYASESLYDYSRGVSYLQSTFVNSNLRGVGDLTEASSIFSNAVGNFNLALANKEFASSEKTITSFLQWGENNKRVLENAPIIVQELPELLGYKGPKNYLVLFYDSNEARPSGGVLESYAEISLDLGKITQISVDDVAKLNATLDLLQLRPKSYEPLTSLQKKEYLTVEDMLWDANFPEAARKIVFLLESAHNKNYSGVFTFNHKLFKLFLEQIGEVQIASYNKAISASTVQGELKDPLSYSVTDSSQKKLPTALLYKVLTQLGQGYRLSGNFVNGVFELLSTKDILVHFPESSFFGLNGFNGSLRYNGQGDFLYIADANLGEIKNTQYIKRNTQYSVSVEKNIPIATLKLVYNHTGNSNAYPVGVYTNYVQVFVPRGVVVREAQFKDPSTGKISNILPGIVSSSYGNLGVIGTVVTVKAKETIEITFVYTLPSRILEFAGLETEYSLQLIKQPGFLEGPFNVQVLVNNGAVYTDTPTQSVTRGTSASTNLYLFKDTNIIYRYLRNSKE